MTAKGHVLVALPFALFGAKQLEFTPTGTAFFIFLVLLGSLFPDIDEPKSYIGRRFWFMSWPIKLLSHIIPPLKHRGLTHLFLVPLFLSIVAAYWKNIWLGGFAFGWFVHTLGDLITVGGIQGYFYPFLANRKIVLLPYALRFYTGGSAEKIVIISLVLLNIYLVYAWVQV